MRTPGVQGIGYTRARKIYVEYFGRLGNQLFQYSTAQAVAKQNGGEVINVDWAYTATTGKRPSIYAFRLKSRDPTLTELFEIKLLTGRTLGRIARALPKRFPRIIVDTERGYCEDLFSQNGSIYLRGYWQSYRYFEDISDALTEQLRPKRSMSQRSKRVARLLEDENCVAIHVRRGDYVHNQEYSKVFVSHGEEYYRVALEALAVFRPISQVIVFSDDSEWCRENLKLGYSTFVVDPPELGDWEDLWVMARARRMVVAASSFSWWAGWLSSKTGGTVVAPRIWRQGAGDPPRDLIPPNWLLA